MTPRSNIWQILNITKRNWGFIALFFLAFLMVGLFSYQDYGMSVDEPGTRGWGLEYYHTITTKSPLELPWTDKYYGPLFNIVLAFGEKAFHLADTSDIFTFYHLFTFLLFFISVLAFYVIGSLFFNNWKYALLGCLLLIVSPRIFADSFYNPKDIPFMCFYIISLLTLLIVMRFPSPISIAAHGITTACLIATRVLGIYMVLCSTIILLLFIWVNRKDRMLLYLQFLYLIEYISFTLGFTALFWPSVYFEPIEVLKNSIQIMNQYPWLGRVLYFGKLYHSYELTWKYLLTYIGITTPITYSVLFIIGTIRTAIAIIRLKFNITLQNILDIVLVLALFYGPFLYATIFRTNLYNGWRQMYFLYPPFILIAVVGAQYLFTLGNTRLLRTLSIASGLLLAVNVVTTVSFMIINHPYEYVYFNRLAGKDMQAVKMNFDLDYWGLTYRAALEYIIQTDERDQISVYAYDPDGPINLLILPEEDRKRIIFVEPEQSPDYFISRYLYHPEEYTSLEPDFTVNVGNARLIVVYKMDGLEIQIKESSRNYNYPKIKLEPRQIESRLGFLLIQIEIRIFILTNQV